MNKAPIVRTFRSLKNHAHYRKLFAKIGKSGQKFAYDFLIEHSEIDEDFASLAEEINKISLREEKPKNHRDIIELLAVTNQIHNR